MYTIVWLCWCIASEVHCMCSHNSMSCVRDVHLFPQKRRLKYSAITVIELVLVAIVTHIYMFALCIILFALFLFALCII